MSTPQATGARNFTLIPNRVPTLLADNVDPNVPLTIYNSGTVGVYLAGDTISGPGSSLPLAPGQPMTWTTAGCVYAYADPSSTSNAMITTTSAIGAWPAPSAAAIASAVAGALAMPDWWSLPAGKVFGFNFNSNPMNHDSASCTWGPCTIIMYVDGIINGGNGYGNNIWYRLSYPSQPALGTIQLGTWTSPTGGNWEWRSTTTLSILHIPYIITLEVQGGFTEYVNPATVALIPAS